MKRIIFALTLILMISLSDYYRPETVKATLSPNDLVVHEWGTFTSIAGKNGVAIDWRPLNGASDLPKFVYTSAGKNGFRGNFRDPGKGSLARVRMETPVIYFYTDHEMDVDVKVNFPNGKVTEWYPQAGVVNAQYSPTQRGRFESGINWGTIRLLPNEKPNFLREVAFSHYYPARETDAVALRVCNTDKTKIEKEKFLFYRGIGNFELPLTVKIDGKNLILANRKADEIKNLIVFENRGGRVGFKFVESLSNETTVARPETSQTLAKVLIELEKVLIDKGLYAKEAKAMIATWKDSWFEEGLRVFYVLPSAMADEILPLTVEPKAKETVRVFVGRTEIITPEMEQDVKKEVGLLRSTSAKVREQAQANLKKHGRFYEPILKSILQNESNAAVREQIQKLIETD